MILALMLIVPLMVDRVRLLENTRTERFARAIDEVADVCARLLHSLETTAPPKSREEEAAKAKARSAERFGLA